MDFRDQFAEGAARVLHGHVLRGCCCWEIRAAEIGAESPGVDDLGSVRVCDFEGLVFEEVDCFAFAGGDRVGFRCHILGGFFSLW